MDGQRVDENDIRAEATYHDVVGKLMESFIENGSYKLMKELTFEKEIIQKNIHDLLRHHEAKRHEIGYNLVAKFTTRKVYQYDYTGLNEFLYDRGLLQEITRLTSRNLKKDQGLLKVFAPYRLQPEFYIKPSFNKAGRELLKVEKCSELDVSLEEAAKLKRENHESLRKVRLEYKRVITQIESYNKLLPEQKVKHKYGSLSRLQKPFTYDVKRITEPHAIQLLMEFGKPNMEKLELYIAKGFISNSEIESFRALKDIKLEFVILDIDEERAILSSFHQRKMSNLSSYLSL
ncbi:hypothetical protein [Bacillus tuaregi]|uniref:hypothetical protein n=1 Tax=Bacillus tuaregi TaxID=1816695 RepID=UPI0009FF1F06|nr:hypothetical protein [Bacillus tuaregi]